MEWYLLGLVAIAVGALVWPWLARRHARATGWLAAVVPGCVFGWLLGQAGVLARCGIPGWSAEWVPQLGVVLSFRLDGPGVLLAMLVSGIGALILVYGGAYLRGSVQAAGFFAWVQLFMVAMLGLAAADNLLVMFGFWELTSVASYLLIGLKHEDEGARKAALRALLVTGAGGLALLAAILLLGQVGGSLSISELQARGGLVRSSPYYGWIFALVVLGAFSKSAQVPFHFWLPGAMAAPTPVSAYLHSATMVKAGVFLLAKLMPVLGATQAWHHTLTLAGALTMLVGAICALAQTDLKRLLAYSTLSALGTLVMLLGLGTELALKAAMVFLVVHALYKAPLFMIAGVVDKAAGTRDIMLLQGLGRRLPLLSLAAVLAALSMSGLPPFVGFIGKELLYEAQMHARQFPVMLTVMGIAANAVNVAVAMKVGVSPFYGRCVMPALDAKAYTPGMLVGPLVLAFAGVLVGLFPGLLGEAFINAAVGDILGARFDAQLKLWHGFNQLLAISAVTLGAGLGLYWFRDAIRVRVGGGLGRLPGGAAVFDGLLGAAVGVAGRVTRVFQHGNLRLYVVAVLVCLAGLMGMALASTGVAGWPQASPVRMVPTGLAVLMGLAGVVALRSRSTVMAVLAMGGLAYGLALLFALVGAPDLALTQVLVETLTLVLFALVIGQLPALMVHERAGTRRKQGDVVVASLAGVALSAGLLAVRAAVPAPELRVSAEMVARSWPDAHGRNVVNVILVDFRALDTLGEICVLAIAALGVGGLLLGSRRGGVRAASAVSTPLFRTAVAWLSPLLFGLSLVLLLRGHNEPGGGFSGGLVAAAGLVLRRMAAAGPTTDTGRTAGLWIAAGLATAMLSMLPSLLAGRPWMQGVWIASVWLPLVGTTKLGTPLMFDCGVFLTVVGASLLILIRLLRGEVGRRPDATQPEARWRRY